MAEYALELDAVAVQRYMYGASLAADAERTQWTEAGIRAGATVADVGCGPGAITVLLAQLVEPDGQAFGVDIDPEALATARHLAKSSGVKNIEFSEGDAAFTGLTPGAFDVVMARSLLGHCGKREQQVIDHLASLAGRGGSLYIVDIVLTGLRIYPPEPDLRELWHRYLKFQENRGNDMAIGLRLGELISRTDLELTDFRGRYDLYSMKGFRGPAWEARDAMSAKGFAGQDDIARWQNAFTRLDESENPPTLFVPFFTAVGRRID